MRGHQTRSHQTVTTKGHAGFVVVTPVGELDMYSTPDLRAHVRQALEDGDCEVLCIDLSQVDFMDSSALGELVRTHRAGVKSGVTVCLVGANATGRRILQWTQLDTVIPTFATVTDARLSLRG
ncbi:MAG TPA: STAS domain-containing protein [Marmoricola sp.]|nr:STAS domain-containing protein [Marmoricola sp.]